jgi:rhodanese-related sulfurtransferase/tetratricopeptide (TPR) repeat protein
VKLGERIRHLAHPALPVLFVALLAGLVAAAPQTPAGDAAERQFLRERVSKYAAERQQAAMVETPAAVLERLRAGEALTVVDLRAPEDFARLHLEGSRSIPLPALLEQAGFLDLPRERPIILVDEDGRATIEALVILRIAGLEARAMSGGMAAAWQMATRAGADGALRALFRVADESAAPPVETSRPGVTPPLTQAPPSPVESPLFWPSVIGGAALLLILAGTLVYFLVWVPGKKRKPLLAALEIIEKDQTASFPEAEQLLSQAKDTGLKARDLAEARFALAYVRARLGKFPDATAVLGELLGSGQRSREALYLHLWLLVRQELYEEAQRSYDESAQALGDLLQTKLLAGIVLLERGRYFLSRSRTDEALAFFDRLRKLQVPELADRTPGDIEDHQVVLGIQDIFEKKLTEARGRFAAAEKSAAAAGKSTLHARVGLLLCQWRESERPELDEEIGKVVKEAEREGRIAAREAAPPAAAAAARPKPRKGEAPPGPADATDAREATEAEAAEPRKLGERELFLRNVFLWHAVSLLFVWMGLPEKKGLPAAEFQKLNERLAKVRAADPAMGDPLLIEGLLRYYFAQQLEERNAAVRQLERACETDVTLPDVIHLVNCEKKLAQLYQEALKNYLELVRSYITESRVPLRLRRQLQQRLAQKFRELGAVDLAQVEEETVPTLEELQARSLLIRSRLERLVRPRLARAAAAEAERIDGLLRGLQSATQTLSKTATEIETTEQDLMVVAGEFLLEEEETAEPSRDTAAS